MYVKWWWMHRRLFPYGLGNNKVCLGTWRVAGHVSGCNCKLLLHGEAAWCSGPGLAPAPVSGHMKLPRFWEAKQSAAAAVILFILYHVWKYGKIVSGETSGGATAPSPSMPALGPAAARWNCCKIITFYGEHPFFAEIFSAHVITINWM